jgi:Arc/MetJ family transcription regulator
MFRVLSSTSIQEMSTMATPSTSKRVTFNADAELLAEAQVALGAATTTDTINEALGQIVRRRRRERLLEVDLSDLTPEVLAEIRRGRTGRW